jgi:hypothetical protein
MKRNVFFAGILASALVFGLVVTGCDTETPLQDGGTVHVATYKAGQVSSVIASQTTDTGTTSIIVKFNAAPNGISYSVYAQAEDKNTIQVLTDVPDWKYTYNTTGTSTRSYDVNTWEVKSAKNQLSQTSNTRYRFGIRTEDVGNSTVRASDIAWSSFISVTF